MRDVIKTSKIRDRVELPVSVVDGVSVRLSRRRSWLVRVAFILISACASSRGGRAYYEPGMINGAFFCCSLSATVGCAIAWDKS